jgi:hypothetical protein
VKLSTLHPGNPTAMQQEPGNPSTSTVALTGSERSVMVRGQFLHYHPLRFYRDPNITATPRCLFSQNAFGNAMEMSVKYSLKGLLAPFGALSRLI